jgi:hypothetical protein
MIEISVKAKVLFRPYRDEFSSVVFFLPTFHPQRDGTGLILKKIRAIRGKKIIRDFPAPQSCIADNPWQKKNSFLQSNFHFVFQFTFY